MKPGFRKQRAGFPTLLVACAMLLGLQAGAVPLQVCCTVPDLGDLVKQVGGDEVSVTVFTKGAEDPHFVEAKPSFVKALSRADLFVEIGMELEIGWAPVLLQNAGNAKVLGNALGHVDASTFITPLEIPAGTIDRSMGDVHPAGNPHYLLDPQNGLRVAEGLRARLAVLRPEKAADFQRRYDDFAAMLQARQIEWAVALKPFAGTQVIADHNMWPYFAACYGLVVSGFLEPKPGMAPTTRHLGEVVGKMKTEHIRTIITASYYDSRHAGFVKAKTGARVVELAHQVGARAEAGDYLSACAYNVKALVEALRSP